MSLVRFDVDPGGLFDRQFTAIEQQNLPFALMQATNKTAFEVRESWRREAGRVFDRPTPLTQSAALYTKATKQRPYAEIFIRDQAAKGTAPAKYLLPEVMGGQRRAKGIERLLESAGLMPTGYYAVPGKGAQLDQYGNIGAGKIRKILGELRTSGSSMTASADSGRGGKRRSGKGKRGSGAGHFALQKQHGNLAPGIYERTSYAHGRPVRSIFIFTREAPKYAARYDILGYARKEFNTLMPFFFERELAKAVETHTIRRGAQ